MKALWGCCTVLLAFALTGDADFIPSYVQCPESGVGEQVYFHNVCNCNEFYQCSNGVPYPMKCPSCLYWNPSQKSCDWPENVACYEPNCPIGEPCDCVRVPNLNDCGFFYQCGHHEVVCKECPSGLHFNAELKLCDRSWSAGCSNRTYSRQDYNYTSPAVHPCPKSVPPDCTGDTNYFAHPMDKRWYYECLSGVAYCKMCTPNQMWNTERSRCEW